MKRYEVHTYTLCQGWINCWTENDHPQTFETIEAAQSEIDEFFKDIEAEIQSGMRQIDEGYAAEDFRIYDRLSKVYVA